MQSLTTKLSSRSNALKLRLRFALQTKQSSDKQNTWFIWEDWNAEKGEFQKAFFPLTKDFPQVSDSKRHSNIGFIGTIYVLGISHMPKYLGF